MAYGLMINCCRLRFAISIAKHINHSVTQILATPLKNENTKNDVSANEVAESGRIVFRKTSNTMHLFGFRREGVFFSIAGSIAAQKKLGQLHRIGRVWLGSMQIIMFRQIRLCSAGARASDFPRTKNEFLSFYRIGLSRRWRAAYFINLMRYSRLVLVFIFVLSSSSSFRYLSSSTCCMLVPNKTNEWIR